MKKTYVLIFKTLLFVSIFFPLIIFGQVDVKWKKNMTSTMQWQEVTTLGNLIISSGEGLSGIDVETGDVIWSRKEHANIPRAVYEELADGPFFSIENNKVFSLIDQFSGDEVFNSAKAGIAKIKDYFLLYNTDAILVAGNSANGDPVMLSVKMSDGSLSWTINEEFGRVIAANELGNDELLIVTLFNNYKLNAVTGNIIWKRANSKEAEQVNKMGGALGKFMKEAANNMTELVDVQLEFYKRPDGDVFYLGSQQERPLTATTSSGEPIMKYTNNYMAYSLSDGSRVWDEDLEVKGMLGHVVFTENGLVVLPDDGNRTKINLFDYETKAGKWGKKGRGIKIKGGVYDYMKSDDGILLVSQTSSNDFLNYLDPKLGVISFDKPVKVKGRVVGIVPLSNSILYITTESMNILDQSTGALKWKKSIQTRPNLTAEHDGKIYTFDFRSGTLKTIDKETEEVKEIATTSIDFQGKEIPNHLEIVEDGIILNSDQNLAKINFDGTIEYMEYYPAPREPGWKRALLYAGAARAAIISAQSHYISGSMAKAEREIGKKDQKIAGAVSQIGDAYSDLGTVASSYAGSAFRRANVRINATKSGRDFMFIMSMQDKEIVLLKVSKITGKIEGQIALGKDREPNYSVDEVTGQVYYLLDNNELISYQAK
jgi:hypothetical protein